MSIEILSPGNNKMELLNKYNFYQELGKIERIKRS
jgi:Uma2 family endonuclease